MSAAWTGNIGECEACGQTKPRTESIVFQMSLCETCWKAAMMATGRLTKTGRVVKRAIERMKVQHPLVTEREIGDDD